MSKLFTGSCLVLLSFIAFIAGWVLAARDGEGLPIELASMFFAFVLGAIGVQFVFEQSVASYTEKDESTLAFGLCMTAEFLLFALIYIGYAIGVRS